MRAWREPLPSCRVPIPARDHERGQHGANDGHDDGDGARYERTAAFQFGVEPVAWLQCYACLGRLDTEAAPPGLHDALRIVSYIVGGIGLRAVGYDLHQRLDPTVGQALLEILRNHHKAAQAAGDNPVRDLPPVMDESDIQITGAGECGGQ